MKAATTTMLLLAAVVVTAAMSPPDAVDHQPSAAGGIAAGTLRGGSHHNRDNNDGHRSSEDENSPLTKLALCVSTCGSDVAKCIMTKCYEPLAKGKGNPVMVPLCLLGCTTDVMSCASGCPNNIAN
ncbi:hypothetical protein EJB05_15743, partial [Eragrostis curvula]